MLQVIHHTAPNVIRKMGKKIPETLYFTGFPAIEATGFVLRSAPVVAERASTGRAATTPSAAQIPCQLDSVVLTNKKAGDTLRYLRLFVRRGDGIRTHDLCVPKIINTAEILENRAFSESRLKNHSHCHSSIRFSLNIAVSNFLR